MRSVAAECKSMTKQFDVVVIGTGTAASTVATACREAGWQVAIIDSLPFGGTGALRGCDPEKVVAELVGWASRMRGKGVREEGLRLDWPDLLRFNRVGIAQNVGHARQGCVQAWSEHKNLTPVGMVFQKLDPKEMHRHEHPVCDSTVLSAIRQVTHVPIS